MNRKIIILSGALAALFSTARADEGMWLPKLVGERIEDMRAKGFMLTAADVYSEAEPSMKDAVVKFGRGCTGELISPEGLLVTNHHCGYSQIQRHSTVGSNFLENGFWAMSRAEELPNPGLEVTFLVRMEDVTDRVLAGTERASGPQFDSLVKANIESIVDQAEEGTHYKASVSKFYYGNRYWLYVNEIFTDVRLVGAPPSAIGKFGGDTDNWMWPRHTGDFSLFRIYAGPDNKPADYSPDNVPYRPERYFPVSTRGVSEGDFTMVYGFPGSTQQFITSDAVRQVVDYFNPFRIEVRTRRLGIIEDAWKDSERLRIAYAAKHSGIANAWKKWQGESLGLRRVGTVEKKRLLEACFEEWALGNPEYEGITYRLAEFYDKTIPCFHMRDIYNETLRAIELVGFAAKLAGPDITPGDGLPRWAEEFYEDYDTTIDKRMARYLLGKYLENTPEEFRCELLAGLAAGDAEQFVEDLYRQTRILSPEAVGRALSGEESWEVFTENDPAIRFYRAVDASFKEKLDARAYLARADSLYKIWVRGLMEYREETGSREDFFPDANLTLRFAYGRVEGYRPEDAVWHHPFSSVAGILEKYRTGIEDYSLTGDLPDIFEANPGVPVNFLASNHTTGGNSGSPVINGRGELVGINFDRTWYSTLSDIEFDPDICRNISLDVRYMLFVIDRVGGASYLIDEMTLR
ncbi:MAG: S46 family peptidase [Rikenellaceae bacterium]|nr:S46 family peptidase [Rikenellaceae bacterium]